MTKVIVFNSMLTKYTRKSETQDWVFDNESFNSDFITEDLLERCLYFYRHNIDKECYEVYLPKAHRGSNPTYSIVNMIEL